MSIMKRISWLSLLGVFLIVAGLIGLYSVPDIQQYVFLPGTEKYGEKLSQAEEKWDDAFAAIAVHGQAENVSLTVDKASQGEITLLETLGGYFQVYPRRMIQGRPLTRGDEGARVIVLDEQLAFQFWRNEDALGRQVTLGDKKYEVVGVAEHRGRVGATGKYEAWIPLRTEDSPAPAIMTLSAVGEAGSSMRTVFQTVAEEAFGEGEAIFLEKERVRGMVLLFCVIFILAFWLLRRVFRRIKAIVSRWIGELRQRLKEKYPRQLIGFILLRTVASLLMVAAVIGVAFALCAWLAGLLELFPEWVPEILVDPASIAQRFRELTAASARPLQLRTPELAEIKFWSGMIRWGLVVALLGWAMKKRKDPDVE